MQLLTYGFMHGSFPHLAFNMLALYMFGAPLEYTWGDRVSHLFPGVHRRCRPVATGGRWWTISHGGEPYPTVGASGGVFGLCCWPTACCSPFNGDAVVPTDPMKARTW